MREFRVHYITPPPAIGRECNLQDVLASEHDDLHEWYVPASEYGVMWGVEVLVDVVEDVSADVVGGTAIVGASTELVTSR